MALLVYDKFQPAGPFFAMDAKDVEVDGETLINYIPIILSEEEYESLRAGETILINGKEHSYEENRIYMIKRNMSSTSE